MPGRVKGAQWAAAAAGLAALAGASVAGAADPVDARLDGQFRMTGKITRADHVRGEHEGQTVKRNWEFTSKCDVGPCDSVVLHRHRGAKKVDRLVLDRKDPGEYAGKGRFFFPIRCAGRVHKKGGEARVKIEVTVTAATLADGQLAASEVRAKYTNPRRINHTQCTNGSLGRDGASYTGKRQSG
jgi:hypothetical protein